MAASQNWGNLNVELKVTCIPVDIIIIVSNVFEKLGSL